MFKGNKRENKGKVFRVKCKSSRGSRHVYRVKKIQYQEFHKNIKCTVLYSYETWCWIPVGILWKNLIRGLGNNTKKKENDVRSKYMNMKNTKNHVFQVIFTSISPRFCRTKFSKEKTKGKTKEKVFWGKLKSSRGSRTVWGVKKIQYLNFDKNVKF